MDANITSILLFTTLLFFQCWQLSLCSRFKRLSDLKSGKDEISIFDLAGKQFLYQYGYLGRLEPNDEGLTNAITTYQLNFDLQPTGILDIATLAMMAAPRCGTPDIVDGINTMNHSAYRIIAAGSNWKWNSSLYTFFYPDKKVKWDADSEGLVVLRYRFTNSFPPEFKDAVKKAFDIWEEEKTPFIFYEIVDSYEDPEHISISFFTGAHGDGHPFDGPGRVLAHATDPGIGAYIHFDADDDWIDGASPGKFDVVTIAVHEIGHVLGLGHTSVKDAVMYPKFRRNEMKRTLHPDDLAGISALYDDDYHV